MTLAFNLHVKHLLSSSIFNVTSNTSKTKHCIVGAFEGVPILQLSAKSVAAYPLFLYDVFELLHSLIR